MKPVVARNTFFLAVAGVFLFGVLVVNGLVAAGAGWLADAGVVGERSVVEMRIYNEIPPFGPRRFLNGNYQKKLESGLSDHVPFRDGAIVANAAVQRGCIAAANVPFGFDAYPTFFDSEVLFVPSHSALTYLPYKTTDDRIDSIRAFGERAARAASRYPGTRFVFVVVQAYYDQTVNPALDLVSDACAGDVALAALEEGLGNADNVVVSTVDYESQDAFYQDFFRTDHHWNYRGSMRAYNSFAGALGLEPYVSPGDVPLEDYLFMGATSRRGLDLVSEEVSYVDDDFSELTFHTTTHGDVAYNHDKFFNVEGPVARFRFYDYYYDMFTERSRMYGPGSDNAVMLMNSYGAGIAPYLARNYKSLFMTKRLHPGYVDASTRFEGLMENEKPTDVFFVANPTDYALFAESCPNYFDPVR